MYDDELEAIRDAIENDENVMPSVDALKAYATMSEIIQVFEDHYGSYQETMVAT